MLTSLLTTAVALNRERKESQVKPKQTELTEVEVTTVLTNQ